MAAKKTKKTEEAPAAAAPAEKQPLPDKIYPVTVRRFFYADETVHVQAGNHVLAAKAGREQAVELAEAQIENPWQDLQPAKVVYRGIGKGVRPGSENSETDESAEDTDEAAADEDLTEAEPAEA